MYIKYSWLLLPLLVDVTTKTADVAVVELSTVQLKVGLYSKSIVYTANPIRGMIEKIL